MKRVVRDESGRVYVLEEVSGISVVGESECGSASGVAGVPLLTEDDWWNIRSGLERRISTTKSPKRRGPYQRTLEKVNHLLRNTA